MSHQHFYNDLVVVAAPDVRPASAAQGAGKRRGQPAPEGRHARLFPAQPPELARPHPVLQADARFPHRQHVFRQLRPAAHGVLVLDEHPENKISGADA